MIRTALAVAATLLLATPALAQNFTAKGYAQGKRDTVLFTQTQTEQRSGDTVTGLRRVYATPDSKEAAVEEVVFEGGAIKRFTLDQKQIGEQGTLEVKDGRLLFSYTAEGKTTTDSENAPLDLVLAATTVPYLRAQWDRMMRGDTIKARLAVLDRKETVGFQFVKIGEAQANGRTVVLVQLKPSSFIIAALVKSIRMTFDKDTRQLIEYSGRVLPRQRVGDKWDTLDADVLYKY